MLNSITQNNYTTRTRKKETQAAMFATILHVQRKTRLQYFLMYKSEHCQ